MVTADLEKNVEAGCSRRLALFESTQEFMHAQIAKNYEYLRQLVSIKFEETLHKNVMCFQKFHLGIFELPS